MLDMPYEDILNKIVQKSGKDKEEVEELIKKKQEELGGLVSKEGAAHIIANELGIKIIPDVGKLTVENIVSGMRNVEIVGKVVKKYEAKEFSTEKRSGRVASFLLGDNTGIIRVVLWDKMVDYFEKLKEGDIVKITNAYSRMNRDRRELHLTEKSKIIINPEGVSLNNEKRKVRLEELKGNEQNVEVYAAIVQVFEPRFFEVCPECGKRVKFSEGKYICQQHGEVTPDYRCVMNLFIDDGSASMRMVVWEPQIEELLNKTHEELIKLREKTDAFGAIRQDLLGRLIRVVGRVNKNEVFDRLEFIASEIEIDPKPPTE